MTARRTRRSASRKSLSDASLPSDNQEEPQNKKADGSQESSGGVAPRRSTRARRAPPSRSTSPSTARTASQRKRRRSFQSNRDNETEVTENSEEGEQQDSVAKANFSHEPQETSESLSESTRPIERVAKETTSDDEIQDTRSVSATQTNHMTYRSCGEGAAIDDKDIRHNNISTPYLQDSPLLAPTHQDHEALEADQEEEVSENVTNEALEGFQAESSTSSNAGNALMTLMDAIYLKEQSESLEIIAVVEDNASVLQEDTSNLKAADHDQAQNNEVNSSEEFVSMLQEDNSNEEAVNREQAQHDGEMVPQDCDYIGLALLGEVSAQNLARNGEGEGEDLQKAQYPKSVSSCDSEQVVDSLRNEVATTDQGFEEDLKSTVLKANLEESFSPETNHENLLQDRILTNEEEKSVHNDASNEVSSKGDLGCEDEAATIFESDTVSEMELVTEQSETVLNDVIVQTSQQGSPRALKADEEGNTDLLRVPEKDDSNVLEKDYANIPFSPSLEDSYTSTHDQSNPQERDTTESSLAADNIAQAPSSSDACSPLFGDPLSEIVASHDSPVNEPSEQNEPLNETPITLEKEAVGDEEGGEYSLNSKEPSEALGSFNAIHRLPTFDQIKARIYFIGCNVHRGKGAERIFANYWSSLSLYLSTKTSAASSRKCRDAFGEFLTTRKLRRLHNILIFALLQRTLQPVQVDQPLNIPRRVDKASIPSPGISQIKNEGISREIVGHPRTKERQIGLDLKDPVEGLERTIPYAPLVEDESVYQGISISDQAKYHSSSSLPGALVVDPFAREMVQREGMRTNETTVWLLTIAVQEYVKSILSSMIAAKESVDSISPPVPPETIASFSENGLRRRTAGFLAFTLPPNERKRVSVVDMACLMTGHPSRKSDDFDGRISRTASERCIHSFVDCNTFSQGRGFEEVRRYISSEILSVAASKRRRVEQATVSNQATIDPVVINPKLSDRLNERHMKGGKEARIRSPVVGLGRGAKDLAALKARAAAAAKSSGAEDQPAEGINDRDGSDPQSAASTPVRGNRSMPASEKDGEAAAEAEVRDNFPITSKVQDTPSVAGSLDTLEKHPTHVVPNNFATSSTDDKIQTDGNGAVNENLEESPTKPVEPPESQKERRGKGFGIKNLAAMRARSLTKEGSYDTTFVENWTTDASSQTPDDSPKPETFDSQFATGVSASMMTPIKTSDGDDQRMSLEPNNEEENFTEITQVNLPPGISKGEEDVSEGPTPNEASSIEPLPETIEPPSQLKNDGETTVTADLSIYLPDDPEEKIDDGSSGMGDESKNDDAKQSIVGQSIVGEIEATYEFQESNQNATKMLLPAAPAEVAGSVEGSG